MRTRDLLTGVLVAIAFACTATPAVAASCPDRDVVPTAATLKRTQTATLCLLNRERRHHGLKKLRAQRQLTKVARAFAKRMVKERFFDHVAPDGSTFDRRIKRSGYVAKARRYWLAENIAWGTEKLATPAEIVDSWMHSPGHRANILTPRFRDIGVGIAPGAPEATDGDTRAATYATEFGRVQRR